MKKRTPKLGKDGRYTCMVNGKRFSKVCSGQREANQKFDEWMTETFGQTTQLIQAHIAGVQLVNQKVNEIDSVLAPLGISLGDVSTSTATTMLAKAMETPKRETVAMAAEKWISLQKAGRGEIVRLTSHLNWLTDFHHTNDLSTEQWETISSNAKAKVGNGWSERYGHDVLQTIRRFFRWMKATERTKKLPASMDLALYGIKVTRKKNPFYTVEEWKGLSEIASPYVLGIMRLMLNCSMTQKDVSDLDWSMIDLKKESLTRRRGKHEHLGDNENIPTVVYHLWPECVAFLKTLKTRTGKVLTRPTGADMVKNRSDWLGPTFKRLAEKLGLKKTIKHIRKTGTTCLGSALQYRGWRELYLANAGGTDDDSKVTDAHYDGTTELPKEVTDYIRAKYLLA